MRVLFICFLMFYICGCSDEKNTMKEGNIIDLEMEFKNYNKKFSIDGYNKFYIDDVGFISLPKYLKIEVGLINTIGGYVIEQVKRTTGSYYSIFKRDNPIFILTLSTNIAEELYFKSSQETINYNESEYENFDLINKNAMIDHLSMNNLEMIKWEKSRLIKLNGQNVIISNYKYTKPNYPVFHAVSYKYLNNKEFYEIECICLEASYPEHRTIFNSIGESFIIKTIH